MSRHSSQNKCDILIERVSSPEDALRLILHLCDDKVDGHHLFPRVRCRAVDICLTFASEKARSTNKPQSAAGGDGGVGEGGPRRHNLSAVRILCGLCSSLGRYMGGGL